MLVGVPLPAERGFDWIVEKEFLEFFFHFAAVEGGLALRLLIEFLTFLSSCVCSVDIVCSGRSYCYDFVLYLIDEVFHSLEPLIL